MNDTRHTQLIQATARPGDLLTAKTLNKIIHDVNTLNRRHVPKANDVNRWVRCVSDVDVPQFSIVEVYDAEYENDDVTLKVRAASDSTEIFAANEEYELYAGGPGWVKLVRCKPDLVKVRAVGDNTVSYGDELVVTGFNVESQEASTGTGTSTGDGPLLAMSSERGIDRLVMVSMGCGPEEFFLPEGDCDCCPGCVCYPDDEDDITTECGSVPCLLKNYRIVGAFPFSSLSTLTWSSGCVFETDGFEVIICEGTDLEETYGSAYWKLTVSDGWHESKLELIGGGTGTGSGSGGPGGLNIVYESVHRFDPFCGNEFVKKPFCSPEDLVQQFPKKICINPVGEQCTACEDPGVIVSCCIDGDTVPTNVYAHLEASSPANCAPLDGLVVTLSYIGIVPGPGHTWTGTFTVSTCVYTVYFAMNTNLGCQYGIWIKDNTGSVILGVETTGTAVTCPDILPVDATGDGSSFACLPAPPFCHPSNVTVTITADP